MRHARAEERLHKPLKVFRSWFKQVTEERQPRVQTKHARERQVGAHTCRRECRMQEKPPKLEALLENDEEEEKNEDNSSVVGERGSEVSEE